MGVYRNISTTFWTDAKVDDDFTPEDKYFYLYLLTNPHTNICGCYEVSKRQIERETGYCWDTITRLMVRMEQVHDVIRYSESNKEVLLLNWDRYNWSKSEKVRSAVCGVCQSIKTEAFRNYILKKIQYKWPDSDSASDISNSTTDTFIQKAVPESESVSVTVSGRYPMDTVSIPYGYPMDRVSDEVKKQKFIKPSLEEVKEYIKSIGSKVDPGKWYNYYESNGWMVGKNPMNDWKASIRAWDANEKKRKNSSNNPSGAPNRFHNFHQREYSKDELANMEKSLIANSLGAKGDGFES